MPPTQRTALGRRVLLAGFLAAAFGALSAPATAAENVSAANISVKINSDVVEMAFSAASCAVRAGAVNNPETLTVIDYSKPSTEKRLFVFDLRTKEVIYSEYVAHGQGSGENMTTRFSNEPNSHATSLGLFVTADTYIGKNGYSLRMNGLDQGFNDNAFDRAIVIHGAPYVNPVVAREQGYLGRSLGCPAVRPEVAHALIDAVKGSGLLFAYGGR